LESSSTLQQQQQQQYQHPSVSNHASSISSTTTKVYNLYRTFVLFNGKEQPHETLPFTGERYTIVYYTSDIIPKVYNNNNHDHDTSNNNQMTTMVKENETMIHPTPLTGATTIANNSTIIHNSTIHVSDTLTAKFNAMKKKLGRKR
jgi:hypothetical protein